MSEQKLREAFESWAKERLSLNVWTDNYSYTASHTTSAWEAWQAAASQCETKHTSEGAEKCDVCSSITARLDGDRCAKWCCHCGARLTGNYVNASQSREALAQQPAAGVELTDEEIIAEYELEMQQHLRGHEKANVIRVCRNAISAHIAKQGGAA